MKYLAVIPARGGSKGIPQKNLALCDGRPLLSYTTEAALGSRKLAGVILSTDCPEIARAGESFGLKVPFLRPPELSTDETPMLPVLLNVLERTESENPDALVLLQPSSPLRTAVHIDEAIAEFERTGADTLVSVQQVSHSCTPGSLMVKKGDVLEPYAAEEGEAFKKLRRQDKPILFARNGPAILIVRVSVLREGSLYGEKIAAYEMDALHSIDIDNRPDLFLAELLLSARREKNPSWPGAQPG